MYEGLIHILTDFKSSKGACCPFFMSADQWAIFIDEKPWIQNHFYASKYFQNVTPN